MPDEVERMPEAGEGNQAESGGDLPEVIDVGALDAQYKPIRPFKDWANLEVDDAIWNRQLGFLEDRRGQLEREDLDRALTVAIRAAAVDTGAIEGLYKTDRGLTYSIAVQEAAWQNKMRSRDVRMPDYFAAQLDAYELATEVAKSERPITEVWIRELHEVLTRPQATYDALTPQGWVQSPLPKGEYKSLPNHVRQADDSPHAYAPVDLTPAEMHRLVDELKSAEFEAAHPVLQAAFAHYGLVAIHPFADGNGRVARAAASVFLRRMSSIPLLIWADQRTKYFDALEAADQGNRQIFIDFLFDRAIDAMRFVGDQLGPQPEKYIQALSKLHVSYGGLTFLQLDQKAQEISVRIAEIANQVFAELQPPPGIKMSAGTGGNQQSVDSAGYRRPIQASAVAIVKMSSAAPAEARRHVQYQVGIAQEEAARYAFQLYCVTGNDAPFDVRLEDVHPSITEALIMQIHAWVKRTTGEALAVMLEDARQSLERSGY